VKQPGHWRKTCFCEAYLLVFRTHSVMILHPKLKEPFAFWKIPNICNYSKIKSIWKCLSWNSRTVRNFSWERTARVAHSL
jgi:hypothetical protein